jgi:hypothetical protein
MADTPKPSNVVKLAPYATDHDFLRAVEGYGRCLNPEQEARLSREHLERLLRIARRACPK